MKIRHALLFLLSLAAVPLVAQADTYSITFDAEVRGEPATGRVILFFITETGDEWTGRRPIEGPFFERPQPIASVPVEDWKPGEPVVIDGSAVAFPVPVCELDFPYPIRVQAILDLADSTERSPTSGPGNLYSDPVTIEVSADRTDSFSIELTNSIHPRIHPAERDNLRWVEYRSELLSEFYGRDVYHRAGVAMPPGYSESDPTRLEWPAVYVLPGYGGREESAIVYAGLYERAAETGSMPMNTPHAVFIVLDPESPLGHHGFTDSPNHGPRGTALVQEFVPHLESQFKLVARPEGRIITGHSSGGWTSLWLALNWPDVFGACWSSAPDPIDFRAFQKSNLYQDESLYVLPDGEETPSYREIGPEGEDVVRMTVREECLMEYAIHPLGGSGQQWDAWMAMFSPKDERSGFPARMFDPKSGKIDRRVVEHWEKYDIARLVGEDWERYGPIVSERIRLVVGEKDLFYLERAVNLFRDMVIELQQGQDAEGEGYILIASGADHSTITFVTLRRWNDEMREHLRQHGLHD